MNSTNSWLLVTGTVLGLAVGQVLFKIGAVRLNLQQHFSLLSWANVPIVAGMVIYAVCTLLWIIALRSLPLRIAYPVLACGFVLVPILGNFLLDEPLTLRSLLGATIIIIGVAVSTSSA